MDKQQYTYNQEWLKVLDQLGFKEFNQSNEDHHMPWPEIDIQEGERLFIEEELCRNRIFVMIHDNETSCCGRGDFEVYIQEDIGDHAIRLPYLWSDLSAWWLHYLKMSFLECGFKKDGKEVKVDLT